MKISLWLCQPLLQEYNFGEDSAMRVILISH